MCVFKCLGVYVGKFDCEYECFVVCECVCVGKFDCEYEFFVVCDCVGGCVKERDLE